MIGKFFSNWRRRRRYTIPPYVRAEFKAFESIPLCSRCGQPFNFDLSVPAVPVISQELALHLVSLNLDSMSLQNAVSVKIANLDTESFNSEWNEYAKLLRPLVDGLKLKFYIDGFKEEHEDECSLDEERFQPSQLLVY